MPPSVKENMALYPNLREHRTNLGLTIGELLNKVENAPSEKSVRRLEKGEPIRLTTVNKLFNTIVAQNGYQHLSREQEIVVVER